MIRALAASLALAGTLAAAQSPAPASSSAPPACPPAATAPTPQELQAAQRDARDRGMLWRISKDGRQSYLYGTLHVGKLAWAMPGPNLSAAIRETDTLALELDPTDPAILQALLKPRAGDTPAVAPLTEPLVERLARQRQAACLPDGVFGNMHPLMQGMSLVILQARHEGLDPGFASELVLAGAARSLSRPVFSLETPGAQLKAVIPDSPAEQLTALDELLAQLEQNRARPVLRRVAQAWADGRLDELENYAQWCDCVKTDAHRAQMVRLLDERNPGLAKGIDQLHAQGKKVLAGVGALHMAGPKGLPALLRAMGYEVQRVAATP